eukprot:5226989-Pyramimonas_sp.AAC.1
MSLCAATPTRLRSVPPVAFSKPPAPERVRAADCAIDKREARKRVRTVAKRWKTVGAAAKPPARVRREQCRQKSATLLA